MQIEEGDFSEPFELPLKYRRIFFPREGLNLVIQLSFGEQFNEAASEQGPEEDVFLRLALLEVVECMESLL